MEDKDFSELFNKFSDMVKDGKIPDEMKNILSSMSKGDSDNNTSSASSSDSSVDFETIMKIKSVIEKMKNYNDPRANLLLSLKPYMKDSRKEKIDQYVKLFEFSKVMEMFK